MQELEGIIEEKEILLEEAREMAEKEITDLHDKLETQSR